MINLHAILSWAAAAILAALILRTAPRGRMNLRKFFFLASAALLATGQALLGALLDSRDPGRSLAIFRWFLSVSILFPAAGLPFFMLFARKTDREAMRRRLPGIITLAVLLLAAAALLPEKAAVSRIHFSEAGPFWGFTVSGYGKALGIFFILANVFFLYGLENTYRAANVAEKVTLKYPMLGILALSAINFIVLGRVLSLSALDHNFMALESIGIIICSAAFLFADHRYAIFEVETEVRRESSSVITIVIAGGYLLSVSIISYISAWSGLPYDRFGISVLAVFIAFLLLSVAASGRARKRVRRFLNENFYLERYNYRKEWRHYARLMASSSTIEDFLSNTISSLCETMMVRKGLIWIDIGGGKSATYALTESGWEIAGVKKLIASRGRDQVADLRGKIGFPGPEERSGMSWIESAAFLSHGEECRGLIALGPKDVNTPYTVEDYDFLSTVADQAALTLENLLMEERILETRQMESFNRFASFVIHDLKNTVGMLSLTAENAKDNIGDKEFQEDAIETIKRSVEKMRGLIDSLNSHKSPASINRKRIRIKQAIDPKVNSLAEMAGSKGIGFSFADCADFIADVDAQAVERIIENLVLNAVEAVHEEGSVSLSVGPEGDGGLRIEVRDTGPGFDREYIETSLFRPFRSTKKNGLGIGLVLCKSLAESHGGRIIIDNQPGGGASVSVIIPPARG